MKTLTAKQLALFNSGDTRIDAYPAERVRVRVQGPTGAFFDVTTYGGNDFLNSVQWGEDIDSPHATASISLRREIEQFSMSPLVVHSAYNHGFVPSAAYAAFLALGREVYIEVAITAMDVDPVAADWFPVFYGVIDSIDPGGDSEIVLSCRDLAGKIADTFIDTERVYAFAAQALRVWAPNTIYAANEYILPATRGQNTDTNGTTVDDPGRGKYYKCTTGGTSGTTEPVWPGSSTIASGTCVFTYEGTTTTAGVAVETVMQQILGDNGLSSTFTLDVPTSPSWNISQFIQQRQPVLEAIRNLAIQIGWDVRFVWKAATSAFVLRLYKPDRAKATVDRTFNNRSWSRITQFATEISGIRNVVRVLYSDPADLWTDGTPKRKSVEVPAGRTSTSITAYGIRFAEIAEDSASQIDTSTEALLMANAALSDLQTPIAAVGLELVSAFPWVELGDRYTLAAGVTPGYALNQIFSADQTLAIYGYSHSASDGAIRTSFKLRGQPALGFDRWEAVSARIKPTHKQTITQSKSGFSNTILPLVGGARLQIAGDIDKGAIPSEVAVHVSASGATFTPSSSTLVAVTRAKTVEIGQLIPGAQYYVRTVQRGLNEGKLVESEPSKAISFIAGTAQAGHVNPHIDTSKKPLNGGFETFQANRFLPDQWRWYFAGAIYPDTTAPGAYTGKIDVIEDGNGISGKRYIKITSQSDYPQNLISGQFTVMEGTTYRVSMRYKTTGTAADPYFAVYISWFDYTATPASSGVSGTGYISSTQVGTVAASAAWTTLSGVATAPANARVAEVYVLVDSYTVSVGTISIDEIRVEETTSIYLPKESGSGIFVDNAYPWADLIGDVSPKQSGTGSATLAAFRGGAFHGWFYAAGDLCDMVFHVPHDYAPGTNLYLHLHWAHNGTAISGSLVVTFGVTYAKGHNQANFPAEVAPVLTVSTPDVATIPQYRHRVDELQLSAASPSATQIDTDDIEPDGLILVGLTATTIPTITGGSTNKPCFFTCDIHYQSTGIGTKNKAPNFYT